MHRRTQIRNHTADVMLAGITATVYTSRLHHFQDSQLPAVVVYTLDEPVQAANLRRIQERTLELVIEIHVDSEGGDVDDLTDTHCVEVEKAIEADWRFGGLVVRSFLVGTTIGLVGEGDTRHGMARLTYAVVYRTDPTAPDA